MDTSGFVLKISQYDKQTLVILSLCKRRKIHAFKAQLCTSNLWILRFAQYDNETSRYDKDFVGMTKKAV